MASVTPRRMSPVRRERLYESLAAHISDFIEAQGLVGGDRLPSERQLATELGVSRATLSRALAALETRGRIEVRHGVGALVRDPAPSIGEAPGLLGEQLASRPRDEVYAAREAMLAGIARAAATNPQSSLRLAMLADDGRARTFEHTWRCIRRLAGSQLLADFDDMLAEKAPDPQDSPRLRASLDALAEAIIRGDGSAAATACLGQLTA
ncbi:FadR/GntR family transcriptional regulator [Blastococcus mobilis]|uniref:DNA-binding transcriptional regulator, FadR family n=1 Tax=Blastococcus mobilis TaxID=1938746 RepID=A0A238VZR9_9ACTN|nr:GntR family transcriptional regulator [Blastococcus mobilis]SNR39728.1 DNA-binding transcriptional regulator, FadR family [Blastococcus mobilis]